MGLKPATRLVFWNRKQKMDHVKNEYKYFNTKDFVVCKSKLEKMLDVGLSSIYYICGANIHFS